MPLEATFQIGGPLRSGSLTRPSLALLSGDRLGSTPLLSGVIELRALLVDRKVQPSSNSTSTRKRSWSSTPTSFSAKVSPSSRGSVYSVKTGESAPKRAASAEGDRDRIKRSRKVEHSLATSLGLGSRFLRISSVKEPTLLRYYHAVADFRSWCRAKGWVFGQHEVQEADKALEQYFEDLFRDARFPACGRDALFGYLLLYAEADRADRDLMHRARRSLKGWQSRCRYKSRSPQALEVFYLFGCYMLDVGDVDTAACLSLLIDSYCRPSEVIDVCVKDVIVPQKHIKLKPAKHYAIVISPNDEDLSTKTGTFDDTIFIGDKGRSWMQDILRLSRARAIRLRRQRLFGSLTLSLLERSFAAAAKSLGLAPAEFTPHVVRHSGPSADILNAVRTLAEVKKWERWRGDRSVARYEKAGRALLQAARLPEPVKRRCPAAESTFVDRLRCALE